MIPANTTIFAAPADDDMVDEARKFITARGYTADDVKLVKAGGCVLVKAKRDLNYDSE